MKINETINSPNNFARDNHAPKLIVYHLADGTYEGTKSWFMNPLSQTSSHFIVGNDGRVCQCVPILKGAWCNGTTTDRNKATWYGYSTVPTVLQLGGNANRYSVSIECEGFWKNGKGALPLEQFDALVSLTKHIIDEVRQQFSHEIPLDREHLVGHFEICPKTKPLCPGEAFPWTELLKRLNEGEANSGLHTQSQPIYRVQVGAFRNKENAEKMLARLRDLGVDGFIAATENP